MEKRAITIIPATKDKFTAMPTVSSEKKKVAAYARVSTDSDEQFTSYEAQIDYYTRYINSRENWKFVGVYTDEGISGTNTKHREGFNRMIADALDGKIDLIVTKSVSRFARNTVDSLVTVRKLKEKGVEVYFEKENIYTLDSKGELLITIMSSLAQEESRSISENVTWGQRKRFADGKVSLPYTRFLGYDKGEDGQLVINKEEAETIKLIYSLYLKGRSSTIICRTLEENGILTPSGKKHWDPTTIMSILKNEKYKGDALLQKKFTVDFLTKKQKVNRGEVPQYYVKNSHEGIISELEFDMVQAEIARRKKYAHTYRGNSLFLCKLICGDCGGFYGPKVWHSTTPEKRQVKWTCNDKYKGKEKCKTPPVTAEMVQEKFVIAYNQLMGNRDTLLECCEEMRLVVGDCSELEEEIERLQAEVQVVSEMVENFVRENASKKQSQKEYKKKYDSLVKRYDETIERLEKTKEARDDKLNRERELRIYIIALKEKPLVIDKWDEELWISLLDTAVVHAGKTIVYKFKDGTEIAFDID